MNTEKARQVLPFCGIIKRDDKGRPTEIFVPASPIFSKDKKRGAPRCAEVTIQRDKGTMTLSCHCRHVDGDGEPEDCIGMASGYLCYHALAAALVCANDMGGFIHFYTMARKQDAQEAKGTLITLKAAFGNATALAVFQGQQRRDPEKEQLRAEIAELKRAQQKPLCTQCKANELETADQKEKGLCEACDRSTKTKKRKKAVS